MFQTGMLYQQACLKKTNDCKTEVVHMITESKLLDRKILKSGHNYDQNLIWVVLLMTAFSLMMIYSASIAYASHDGGSPWFYLERQAIFVAIGGLGALAISKIPMWLWKKATPYVLGVSFILLVAVLFGREVNGAKRWIGIGPFNIQPSEVFKLAAIFYLSSFFTRRADILKDLKKVWYVGIPIGLGLGLLMMEPDFGSTVVVTVIFLGLVYLAGLPARWFAVIITFCVAALGLLILIAPYRMARMTSFLDPFKDPMGKGYQLSHALMAIARGEWFGVGLGASLEKRFYLPEAHTDFIMAVVGEEFGLLGVWVVILAFVVLVRRIFMVARESMAFERNFQALATQGVGIWLGVQGFINMGVNMGMLPTKGLTLPFISYGGSALLFNCLAMAFVLRVDYENRRLKRGEPV